MDGVGGRGREWQQGLGTGRPVRGRLTWSSRQMDWALNQGRRRRLERERWIPEMFRWPEELGT